MEKKCELGSSVIIVAVEDKWKLGNWNQNIKVHIAALYVLAKSALIRVGAYLLIQSCSNFHQMFTAAQRLNQTQSGRNFLYIVKRFFYQC